MDVKPGSQQHWTEVGLESIEGGLQQFESAVRERLQTLVKRNAFMSGYCAMTGAAPGAFSLLYKFGAIADLDIRNEMKERMAHLRNAPYLPGITMRQNRYFLPLTGHGELFGYFIGNQSLQFSLDAFERLKTDWELINRDIADLNFTRRVHAANASLFHDVNFGDVLLDELPLLDEVVKKAALIFGADGAVIRVYDDTTDTLVCNGSTGDVTPLMIGDRRAGELLSGRVFNSSGPAWSAIEMTAPRQVHGLPVPAEVIDTIKQEGVKAVICARIDDPLLRNSAGGSQAIRRFGTLSYCFLRPNRFSWRDVSLFLGFVRRVGDAISLIRQSNKLYERNHLLEIQAPFFMQAELAHLLVHDLSHKVLNVESHAVELMDKVRMELRKHRDILNPEVNKLSQQFQESMYFLKKELIDLRSVGKFDDNLDESIPSSTFSVIDVIQSLAQLMKSALERQKIEIKAEIKRDIRLHGRQKVFEHVILNFIINTIDAAKTRKSERPMVMHFSASVENNRVRLKIWDTGPGIDQSKFPLQEDVFKIGKTSKPHGTGMGLPVARNILDRFFKGSIQLVDPRSALFELTLPMKG